MRRTQRNLDCSQHSRHAGSVTLEFIIAFPLVFIAALAIAQFFFLALTIEGATTALNEGIRKGAQAYGGGFPLNNGAGGDNDIADKMIAVMNAHLEVYRLEIVNGGGDDAAKGNVTVGIARGGAARFLRGGGACPTVGPGPSGTEIVVDMCFDLTNASTDRPVPNWLATFGFDLTGTTFEMTSRASLE